MLVRSHGFKGGYCVRPSVRFFLSRYAATAAMATPTHMLRKCLHTCRHICLCMNGHGPCTWLPPVFYTLAYRMCPHTVSAHTSKFMSAGMAVYVSTQPPIKMVRVPRCLYTCPRPTMSSVNTHACRPAHTPGCTPAHTRVCPRVFHSSEVTCGQTYG